MRALLKLKIRLMKDNFGLYIVMIVMSLVIAGVFGGSMGGSYKPTLAVVDNHQSVDASGIISRLGTIHQFNVKLVNYDEAIALVSDREVDMALIFNKAFATSEAGVEIVQLKASVESYQIKQLLENEIELLNNSNFLVDEVSGIVLAESPLVSRNTLGQEIRNAFNTHWKSKRPITVTTTILNTNDAFSAGMESHYIVGMTLFFVTYSLLFTVGDILEDKRLRTLDRMMVSPRSRYEMLMANLICAVLIGIIQILVMVLSGQFLFGIDWGANLGLVIAIGVLYIIVMTALSLFVVSIVKTVGQLGAVSPIILTGMGMLGGCMWPLEIISSKALLFLANFTPHKWAIAAMKEVIVYGAPSTTTYTSVSVLLVMGILFLFAGERVMYFKSLRNN